MDARQLDYSMVPMLSQTSMQKSKCISKYSLESIFLLKGNSAIKFNHWNDNSEKLKGSRKNGGFDYNPYEGFSG